MENLLVTYRKGYYTLLDTLTSNHIFVDEYEELSNGNLLVKVDLNYKVYNNGLQQISKDFRNCVRTLDNYLVEEFEDGKSILMDLEGRYLTSKLIGKIEFLSERYLKLRDDNGYGVFDLARKTMIIPCNYVDIQIFNIYFVCLKSTKFLNIYTDDGRVVDSIRDCESFKVVNDVIFIPNLNKFINLQLYPLMLFLREYDDLAESKYNRLVVRKGRKYGVITRQGIGQVPFEYDGIKMCMLKCKSSSRPRLYYILTKGQTSELVDNKLKQVISPRFGEMKAVNNVIVVSKGDINTIFNPDGQPIIENVKLHNEVATTV